MRQVKQISLVRGWVNGNFPANNGFSPIEAPQNYPVWTINYSPQLEFLNDAATRALSGYQRAGISGQRLSITASLRGGSPTQYERIRTLLSSLSSQKDRTAFNISIGSIDAGDMTLDISGVTNYSLSLYPFTANGAVTNCYIRNTSLGQDRLVSSFNASNNRLSVQGLPISNWLTTHSYQIVLLRSQPTVVGIGTVPGLLIGDIPYASGEESWKSGFIWCNLTSSAYDISRELTVGTQVVNLQFESVERFNEIPEYMTIGL